jgi:hypothetical protein
MWNRRYRWIRRLTAGLAFAAIVAPSAQARIAGNEWGGVGVDGQAATAYNGYGYQHSPGVPVDQQTRVLVVRPDDRAVRVSPQPVDGTLAVRPDDRAVRVSPQPVDGTLAVRPDDRAVRFTPAPSGLVQAPQLVAQPSNGFDWGDAGVGAGVLLGLMLLGLGAGLITRHGGRKALAGA